MKVIRMKGKTVEEATNAALAVLGVSSEQATVRVVSEGKPGMLGVIGGEEAEVEVSVRGTLAEEAREIIQNILDKMGFLAIAEVRSSSEDSVSLEVKGEDISRIIGKEGNMLRALDVVASTILFRIFGRPVSVSVDAGGYRQKRVRSLERLADEVARDVVQSGEEKILPPMSAADRRVIHLYLANNPKVITFSKGEGRERRLIVAPRK